MRFEGVRFGYDPGREILSGLDLDIPPGTSCAIVGPSGAGKSTIARLLYRFYDPTQGGSPSTIRTLPKSAQKSLRAAIGIVPQDTVLFNDTIGYNIGYGREGASQDEIEGAARGAAIDHFIAALPEKYESMVGERGLKLSGGEKQRVAIARTLLKNPPILVLDEATSALDSRTEDAIQQTLDRFAQSRTTIMIAHRLSTIVNADQIVVLDNGQVVERGTHEQLLERNGVLRRPAGTARLARTAGGRDRASGRIASAAAQSAQDVPFGAKIKALVVDPPRVGEHQIVVFHLLRPPIAWTVVTLRLRMGRHIGQRCIAITRFVPALHRQVMIARDPPPFLAAVEQPVIEGGVRELGAKRVADAEGLQRGGIEVFGQNSEARLHRCPSPRVGRPKFSRPTLREQSAIEGAKLVLLPIEALARSEIDIGEPQMPAAAKGLMLEDRRGARAVRVEAIAVAEQYPAVPQIFVIAVGRRSNCRAAAAPFAGHAVDRIRRAARRASAAQTSQLVPAWLRRGNDRRLLRG